MKLEVVETLGVGVGSAVRSHLNFLSAASKLQRAR